MQDLKFKVFYEPSGKIYDVLAMDFIKKNVTVEYKKGKTQVVGMIFCHIMQYTGLKDINGREIYEGDIIKISKKNIITTATVNYDATWGGFCVVANPYEDKSGFEDWLYSYALFCEVIGNIYENPDLLE